MKTANPAVIPAPISVIPASIPSFPPPIPSFPRKRESTPQHTDNRTAAVRTVIPACAGIQPPTSHPRRHPAPFPRPHPPVTPATHPVIPAKAGIHTPTYRNILITATAIPHRHSGAIRNPEPRRLTQDATRHYSRAPTPSSFPPLSRHSRESGNPHPNIPKLTDNHRRHTPPSFRRRPESRTPVYLELAIGRVWIPAFAGMTVGAGGMTVGGAGNNDAAVG